MSENKYLVYCIDNKFQFNTSSDYCKNKKIMLQHIFLLEIKLKMQNVFNIKVVSKENKLK